MNDKFVQIQGPFNAKQDVTSLIKQQSSNNFSSIKKIGIQSKIKHQCSINDCVFEIGSTGILEFDEVKVVSLYFLQSEDEDTIIDCIIG
jgi:hypothetical protein